MKIDLWQWHHKITSVASVVTSCYGSKNICQRYDDKQLQWLIYWAHPPLNVFTHLAVSVLKVVPEAHLHWHGQSLRSQRILMAPIFEHNSPHRPRQGTTTKSPSTTRVTFITSLEVMFRLLYFPGRQVLFDPLFQIDDVDDDGDGDSAFCVGKLGTLWPDVYTVVIKMGDVNIMRRRKDEVSCMPRSLRSSLLAEATMSKGEEVDEAATRSCKHAASHRRSSTIHRPLASPYGGSLTFSRSCIACLLDTLTVSSHTQYHKHSCDCPEKGRPTNATGEN